MKTLFRIFLVFIILLVIAVGVGYLVVTRPAFQKKLVESQLPAGSSISFVKITTGSIELTDLMLQLPDGTTAKLDSLRSDFSPMAALFDNTLQVRGLTVDGLIVRLPEVSAASTSAEIPTTGERPTTGSEPVTAPNSPNETAAQPSSLTDALYALGNLTWMLDFDSINLNGALIDASRNRYTFDVQSDRIAPGEASTLTAALKLESKQALQGGLKDFSSDARLSFNQKKTGGFEQLTLESQTSGAGADGGKLLSITQTLELSVNGFEESAELALSFKADLPHPEVFAPQLVSLQGLSLLGELKAAAEGSAFTLQTADFEAASNGAQVASVKLKQSLTLGAQQKVAGELMDVSLINLPLAWLNPWLTNGMQLSGAPLSVQIALSGESSGALSMKTLAPLQLGPLSLTQDQQALLQEVTLRMNPTIRVEADQTIRFDLGDFALLDRYGAVISGTVSGAKSQTDSAATSSTSAATPLAGLQAKAKLDIGLAELLQQPALAGIGSVLAGQVQLTLNIDGAAEYPAEIQAAITGLRARSLPGSRQDYRLTAQLKQNANGSYALGSSFEAGSESRPTTSLQLAGQVNLEAQPKPFKVNLTSPRVLQSDIDLLIAALQAQPTAPTPLANTPPPTSTGVRPVPTPQPDITQRPPWADLDGEVAIQIESLTLASGQTLTGLNAEAKISEALLAVSKLKAVFQEGRLAGQGQITFDPKLSKAYTLSSELTLENIDPAIFSQKPSGSFPVRGLFEGDFSFTGSGATLEAAIEDSEGDLTITGRDGVLTAFELDQRSQLGLLGAGILGQQLNRPGITALSQAVPYFKDMPFESFTLKLVRAQDKRVSIPEISFMGDHLRLQGQGVIAASSLGEVLDQPLDLTLGLAAKGRLVDYLETLQLLGTQTSEDGFRNWNQNIKIGGSLAAPDTSALKDLLNTAARSALSRPSAAQPPATPATPATPLAEGETAAPTAPKERTRDERRRDDIEMGLDLLNSVFGR